MKVSTHNECVIQEDCATIPSVYSRGGGGVGGSGRGYCIGPFWNMANQKKLTDRPSNLKEAIDWILRVTGKDGGGVGGGGGDTAINDLTEQIKKLLKSVENSGTGLGNEIKKVVQALDGGQLITKLAEGLQQFIGYQNGTIKHNTQGIGLYNDPLERFQEGVLNFWKEALQVLEMGFSRGATHVNLNTAKSSDLSTHLENYRSKRDINGLADAFQTYLGNVLQKVEEDVDVKRTAQTQVQELKTKLETLLRQVASQHSNSPFDFSENSAFKTKVDEVWTALTSPSIALKSLPGQRYPNSKTIVMAVFNATKGLLTQLMMGYQSSYQGTTTNELTTSKSPQAAICAKIFLSCLPLIFSNLHQLYWKCKQEKAQGGWKEMQLNGSGRNGADLKHFMDLMTFSSVRLNGAMTGDNVVSNAFKDLTEFSTAASSGQFYTEFLNTFKTTGIEKWTADNRTAQNTNFLSGLYLCSSWYFQGCQAKMSQTRPPSSIREMLYWLMGLTATPQFGDLLGHIHNVVGSDFKVAVSGSSKTDETLTADKVTSYILSICYTSPSVLDIIQGSVPPQESNDKPWLHDLYSNTEFPFKYPSSGAALFYALSDYTYALQFQLSFLYKQCQDMYINTCGWQFCTFGKDINNDSSNGEVVTSHICHAGCTHGTGSSSQCSHNDTKCGTDGQASPLQAFLTDKLQGFRRGHPGTSDHLASCYSNSMCHVPMGFKAEYLRETPGYGYHVFYPLLFYCSDHTRPLRLLSDKLHCIANYTPRSLGDMLGFYLHLTRQVFNVRTERLSEYITNLLKTKQPQSRGSLIIFESVENSIVELGSALHGVVRHCHNRQTSDPHGQIKHQDVSGQFCSHSKSPADLWSLLSGMDNNHAACRSAKCGAYMSPLTRSYGSTFGKSAGFASTYLSWVSYLADDFKERLEGLLIDFTNITCNDCKTQNGGECSCSKGQHGTSNCQCDSVVSCSGVLPLFYEHGFNFFNVKSLSGKVGGVPQTKRNCAQFHSQLQSVISGHPLSNLLNTIDTFLFLFRYYFLSNLSAFWNIYMCLILYTFFFLLDTLHLRSHLKLTSSHTVPPLALLTQGTHLPVTKLTYIGQ
ncbi:variant erythrocyte surface antigen-1 family protein [Babesia caballi]|uniref:Variant erythrocyte surface antigen-1 family protein n=1 Tax=Babesia caballi TaxID=5871 RepID=A0AAV4LZN3_BABCB|nr:variant erythrocyte surface antigen-1 family protein [Babesia caballi]